MQRIGISAGFYNDKVEIIRKTTGIFDIKSRII